MKETKQESLLLAFEGQIWTCNNHKKKKKEKKCLLTHVLNHFFFFEPSGQSSVRDNAWKLLGLRLRGNISPFNAQHGHLTMPVCAVSA